MRTERKREKRGEERPKGPLEELKAEELEPVRLQVKWVYEDEIGRICPLCGKELREALEGHICYSCNVIYKQKRRPVADVEEEEAQFLKITKDLLEEPGVKLIILKNYPFNFSGTFTTKCEGYEASVYNELARRGVRTEELIARLTSAIEKDAAMRRVSIITLTKPGLDPWSRKGVYLEKLEALLISLLSSPCFKDLRLVIVTCERTIFYERLAEDVKKILRERNIEFEESAVEIKHERVLKKLEDAGLSDPKMLLLAIAFPRILKHLRRGKTLSEAVEVELASSDEEEPFIIQAVKKFEEKGAPLDEYELRELLRTGGMRWIKLLILRSLGLVREVG